MWMIRLRFRSSSVPYPFRHEHIVVDAADTHLQVVMAKPQADDYCDLPTRLPQHF